MKSFRMIARAAMVLGAALLANVAGMAAPAGKSSWGIVIADAGGQGVAVVAVSDYSPAKAAGVKVDDVLLSIDGVAVRSAQAFRAVKNAFPLYSPLKLTLRRAGALVATEIRLSGIIPLEVKPVRNEFIIPAVPPPPADPSAPADLDRINVLDQIIRDPVSGRMAVLGHYDPRFNTGPIPYLDLLKTALAYPQPKLDLESPIISNKVVAHTRTWSWSGKEFILGHPDLELERQLLIRLWAGACGLRPEELVALYNYTQFGPAQVVPDPAIRAIEGKILASLGYADAAQAFARVNQGGAGAADQALQLLGPGAAAQAGPARAGEDPAAARGRRVAEVYLAILDRIHVSEVTVANLRDDLDKDRCTWEEAVLKAQGYLLPRWPDHDRREQVLAAINKLRLSEAATRALTQDPLPSSRDVVITPLYLDRASQLTRILYEADYSLKSMKVMPQLFWDIPGSMSEQEYSIGKGITTDVFDLLANAMEIHYWLEPKRVEMTLSPDRKVISFGTALMDHKSEVLFNPGQSPGGADKVHYYDDWCAAMMSRYDDYAHILPALHKVREAAKVIALANWLIEARAVVDFSGVHQEPWEHPDKVDGFWRSEFLYLESKDAESGYTSFTGHAGLTGGVTFRKSNWTQMTPAPQGETAVASQLTVSAGLGQQAALAARNGDLEQARHLAELSAQAMTGRLAPGALAKLPAPLPQIRPVAVTPEAVQRQKAMLRSTQEHIETLARTPAQSPAATQARNQLDQIYSQFFAGTPGSGDLTRLQTGRSMAAAAVPPPESAAAPAPQGPRPACAEGSVDKPDLVPEHRQSLEVRLGDVRNRMRTIDEALRRIAALNAKDLDQLNAACEEITRAYDKAKERVVDLAADALLDTAVIGNDRLFGGVTREYEASRGRLDEGLKAIRQRRQLTLDPAALRQLDDQIQAIGAAQARLKAIYDGVGKLHAVDKHAIKAIQYGKGVATVAGEGEDLMDQVRTAFHEGVGILLDHPQLEELWKASKFLRKARFDVVSGAWTYGQYIVDYSIDLLSQRYAWEPLVDQLRANLDANRKAVLSLQRKAALAHSEAACLENLLR